MGCFSLLQGCYLLLVTKKRLHGSVCGEGAPSSKDNDVLCTALTVANIVM